MAKRTKLVLLCTLLLYTSSAFGVQEPQALSGENREPSQMSLTNEELEQSKKNVIAKMEKEYQKKYAEKDTEKAVLYPVREKPTYDNKTKLSLKLAQKWVDMDYKPIIQNGKIIHFYGQSVPTVVLKPLFVSNIELSPDETIVPDGIHVGDKVCWNTKEIYSGEGDSQRAELIIKSKCLDETQTALIISTTKRVYHIKLISTNKKQKNNWTPYVGFSYPDDPVRSLITLARLKENKRKIQIEKELRITANSPKKEAKSKFGAGDVNFEFTVKGDRRIRPLRVYSLGHQTVIEMKESITRYSAPALLVEDLKGKTELVSYRFKGNRYIIDQRIDKATLITGVGKDQIKVTIENMRPDNV